MAQHGFAQMGGHGGGSIDPSDLAMSGGFNSNMPNNFSAGHNPTNPFASGSAVFGDDELLDGLGSPTDGQAGMQHGQDFGNMNDVNPPYQNIFNGSHHSMPVEQNHINGYSHTPEGDPIQSPFVHNFTQYRQMHHPQTFGASLQSPISYTGSPLANDMNHEGDANYLHNNKARPRMAQAMQRKPSSTQSPLTPKAAAMAGLSLGTSQESSFGPQQIRAGGGHHEKSHSAQWIQTPNSLSSFPGSGFSSPMQAGLHNNQALNEMLLKAGTSMPAKLGTGGPISTQEAKRKRRRESHNLVERRRRDNINERIQDLSKLVPTHRLEDEKIRKMIANGTPLSPSLTGMASPTQATSGLAGPGARRATSGTAGNITTGLPLDDKDKGPNKGDILNGAVSWTRDLMWMLHLKIQQQEELINCINELGGQVPLELTDDERRMQTELMEALGKSDEGESSVDVFSYSRTNGTGLRVPDHTDYKGEPLNGASLPIDHHAVITPEGDVNGAVGGHVDANEFWNDDEDSGDMNFKEEDEFMDLGQ